MAGTVSCPVEPVKVLYVPIDKAAACTADKMTSGRRAVSPQVYPDMEEFWADLAAAYNDEVQRLARLGCTYLQLDDTSLAYLNDPAQRAQRDHCRRTATRPGMRRRRRSATPQRPRLRPGDRRPREARGVKTLQR